jgi:CBS domain-containing protein
MSISEQKGFIGDITPFNRLDNKSLEELCQSLDITYFKKDETILKSGEKPEFLYFMIKGVVQEIHQEEVVSVYIHHQYFDPISLIENNTKHDFLVIEEVICYTLPRELFLNIMYKNKALESFFFQSISKKLNSSIEYEQSKELVNFMIAKVKDAYLQKPLILDGRTTIFDAVNTLKGHRGSSLLVQGKEELGIVTDTDFREKIVLNRMSFDEPISKLATFGIKTVDANDFLFNAQIKMTKYGVKRLIAMEGEDIVGVLDLISLTSFFASHTYAVMMEVDNTTTVQELKVASEKFINVIRTFYAKGVKVRYISKVISQLNDKLFAKLYELLAPEELKDQAALIIMGSEGRGEQILRTDQDNALIISDNCTVSPAEIEDFANKFTEHLVDMGYPRCDGNIMICNPFWRKNTQEFEKKLYNWIESTREEDLINLAIFYDALCVAGDKYLLIRLKEHLSKIANSSKVFFTFFAKPVLNFATPLGMFANFVVDKKEHKDELDIKKGGIFPIVHGVRALSLEKSINKTNTVDRIKDLNDIGVIDKEFAWELIEAFTFLLSLRLKSRLEKIDSLQELDNYINPSKLNILEKDLLKDSFKIVDKFKKFISHHFELDRLS